MIARIQDWGTAANMGHALAAIPFAWAAMATASRANNGWPGWRVFGFITLALFCGRILGTSAQKLWDRQLFRDPNSASSAARTAIPNVLLTLASGIGLVYAAWSLNPLCLQLSPVCLLAVSLHPAAKRFTDFTPVWLGFAAALAPIGAWLAVRGRVDWVGEGQGLALARESIGNPMVLGLVLFLGIVGFDLVHSTLSHAEYRQRRLGSIAVRWGVQNALAVAFLAHLFMWAAMVVYGILNGFRLAYWAGLVVILFLLLMEHWLARRRNLQTVSESFLQLGAVTSIVFLMVVVIEISIPWVRLQWR